MYSKIAVGNVKKSFKDYAIYFLTLTLAVCIFYSFNSIESQAALSNMKFESSIGFLKRVMGYISVFVSVILGSLMLYANNFLIKKRKKELGIYMTLGMGKKRISQILVTETLIVGVVSLIGGLILGIAASQGLSALILKLFDIPMNEYRFAVSTAAAAKTIGYFGLMFLVVMVFNVFVTSKYKVIDLLTAGRKNENVKFENPIIYLITFALCVISLGYAYKTILKIGLDFNNVLLPVSIILGILGTVLFFFSLSGFILYVVKKNKNIYFKDLNIFITKQINSKVNTNFLSMSLICLMLFTTIVILSTGISFKQGLESGLKDATPFDASIILRTGGENYNLEDVLNDINFKMSENEKYEFYNEYDADIAIGDLINGVDKRIQDFNANFVKISDYNKILKLKGEKEVNLNKDEVLLSSGEDEILNSINKNIINSNKLNIKGKEYLVKNNKVVKEELHTSNGISDNLFTVIINDDFLSDCKINTAILNVNYLDNNREENNKKYDEVMMVSYKAGYTGAIIPQGLSKDKVYREVNGDTTIILFIGIYLGIVFLITSMAVLALQQLSEASDSIDRYKAIKKIGANEKMINKTIFIQTLIYFSLPVVLAVIHSVVGIKVASDFANQVAKQNIIIPTIITASIFIVVYAGYFFTTYVGYKNIVKSNI